MIETGRIRRCAAHVTPVKSRQSRYLDVGKLGKSVLGAVTNKTVQGSHGYGRIYGLFLAHSAWWGCGHSNVREPSLIPTIYFHLGKGNRELNNRFETSNEPGNRYELLRGLCWSLFWPSPCLAQGLDAKEVSRGSTGYSSSFPDRKRSTMG